MQRFHYIHHYATIEEATAAFAKLAACDCCEMHSYGKPSDLKQGVSDDWKAEYPPEVAAMKECVCDWDHLTAPYERRCRCDCRHAMRFMCREFDDFVATLGE